MGFNSAFKELMRKLLKVTAHSLCRNEIKILNHQLSFRNKMFTHIIFKNLDVLLFIIDIQNDSFGYI
jgi:hypothetical protein